MSEAKGELVRRHFDEIFEFFGLQAGRLPDAMWTP
jgi:hypothetical protein